MLKKLMTITLPVLMIALLGLSNVNSGKSVNRVNAEDTQESILNAVKEKVSMTFEQDALGKTTHKDYNNSNYRRQTKTPASGYNVFTFVGEADWVNTEVITDSKAGSGAYKRITNESIKGLVLRANTDHSWLDNYTGTDFTINFFVKNQGGANYYEGLYSFRHGSAGYNIDVGVAGFWCNSINTSDVSDNTYRKYSNASTGTWAGRTSYNNFDNGSFRTSAGGATADNMLADKWYMITYTFSATDGLTIYRDGVKKINLTNDCMLVGNNGDPDPWTVDNLRSKLLEILMTKNTRVMFFRGQSSQRTVGVCTDELTIFRGALTEDEIKTWMDSYVTLSYVDSGSTLKTYTDVAKNLVPTYTPTKEDHTFYKWATDEKLLTQMSQELQYADYSVYADWKDTSGVSDGAKLLAQDIVSLNTCTEYAQYATYEEKISLLDATDMAYVNNYEFTDSTGTYTIREKLDYMAAYSNHVDPLASTRLLSIDGSNGAFILFVTGSILVFLFAGIYFFSKRKQRKTK